MKHIAVIGGGISGLAVLHYLKKRYSESVKTTLYERNGQPGGTIGSENSHGFIFETGPNGFLSNPSTLEFIEESGLSSQIIYADESAKRRYIQLDGKLFLLPTDPWRFLQTPLLSPSEKIRFINGLFNSNVSKDQSVYDYASKRFGEVVTDRLIDPFLTGIYAGDIKRLHMDCAFPKIGKGQGKGILCSFKDGMGSLIDHVSQRYRADIHTNTEIQNIKDLQADLVILAVPAYVAADLLGVSLLHKVVYSPVTTVGLKVSKKSFRMLPDGFGYLIPSSEGKEILGVLLESNVFPREISQDEMVIRIMLGGAHHPEITQIPEKELLEMALREIDATYGLKGQHSALIKIWPKGIPQYNLDYPKLLLALNEELRRQPYVRLCANYIGGISFNDCIKNARQLVNSLN